jgi:hypothetical protein
MSETLSKETVLRVTADAREPLDLRLEAGAAVAVRVEPGSACGCQGGHRNRPGSYVDTDFGTR